MKRTDFIVCRNLAALMVGCLLACPSVGFSQESESSGLRRNPQAGQQNPQAGQQNPQAGQQSQDPAGPARAQRAGAEDRQQRTRPGAARGESAGQAAQSDAWLGVLVGQAAAEGRAEGRVDAQQSGINVERIFPSGPAARAGLYPGDSIVEADGKKLSSPEDFVKIVENKKAGDSLDLVVIRDGERQTISASLGNRRHFFPMEDQEEREFAMYRGESEGEDDEDPACAMWLEQERHAAVQRQRIEELITSLKEEVQALRQEVKQLRGQQTGAATDE